MLLEISKHHFSSQLRSQQSTSALMGLEWRTAGQSGQQAKQLGFHFPKVLPVPSLPAASRQGQERPPAPGVLPQGCDGNDPCESCLSQLVLLWKGGLGFFFSFLLENLVQPPKKFSLDLSITCFCPLTASFCFLLLVWRILQILRVSIWFLQFSKRRILIIW